VGDPWQGRTTAAPPRRPDTLAGHDQINCLGRKRLRAIGVLRSGEQVAHGGPCLERTAYCLGRISPMLKIFLGRGHGPARAARSGACTNCLSAVTVNSQSSDISQGPAFESDGNMKSAKEHCDHRRGLPMAIYTVKELIKSETPAVPVRSTTKSKRWAAGWPYRSGRGMNEDLCASDYNVL